jgi:serine/threonine protein kinase
MELLGKTLGNFRIDRLLAKGSMGVVYQAYDLPMERNVAIKVIHPRFARQPSFRERFPHEASKIAQLDHPGIVRILDFGQHKDHLYIVMEYLPGANLRQLLDELIRQREWISLNDAIRVVEQLCETMEYAHQHNALYWDLNPANIMIKPQPAGGLPFQAVLIDLQLARLVDALENNQEELSLGMPAYLSPEQVLEGPIDARSNVYALGILLYELVVGIPPFPIKTHSEAVLYHSREVMPAPRSVRPDLPEGIEQVIMKALEKEPDARYQSAAALGAALDSAMSDVTEILEVENAPDGNLFKKYQESLTEPAPPLEVTGLTSGLEIGSTELQPVPGTERMEQPKRQIVILVSLDGNPPQTFTLDKETVTIGRDKENDLILDDLKISRRHAQITWDGSNHYAMDLNSANGTYLEGARLQPGIPTVWRSHQELQMGGASLRLMNHVPTGTVAENYGLGPRTVMGAFSDEPLVVTVTPQQLTVEAGDSVTATLSLLNQTPEVDSFLISLTGIPNDWVSSLPPHVQLIPGEQQVTAFTLHIPRTAQSRAGRHPITLRVTSQMDPSQAVELKIILTIAAYSEFKAELQPPQLRAGQIARIAISNLGNIQDTFTVRLTDSGGALAFQPPQLQLRIPEGKSGYAEFRAQESQLRLLGGDKSHTISAYISSSGTEPQALHAELVSPAVLPVWVLPTAGAFFLLAVTAAALLLFWITRTATLTVVKNGDGVITSLPAGIDCGLTCSSEFRNNRTITLTAMPLAPSTFGGWSGSACSGTLPTCDIQMRTDQTVTAIFNPPGSQTLIINKSGTGDGAVTSSPVGIDCGSVCTYAFAENTLVTLTATATSPSTFGGWSGACSGTSPVCVVTLNAVQTATATFNPPGKQTLTVNKGGTGTGSVTSSPGGINNCTATCTFDFDAGTTVTLTANAAAPSTFAGWSGGGCSGTGLTCIVTMNAAQNVTATFSPPPDQTLTVIKSGTGAGTVTSSPAGINCGATCTFGFAMNASVTLTASPAPQSTFGGWSGGGCTGTTPTCVVSMNQAQSVTATFNPPGVQRLTIERSGDGVITSAPPGINCGTTCAFDFAFNTPVTLTASPAGLNTFGGWGGACSGTATSCTVTMGQAQRVTATFNPPGSQTLTVNKSGAGAGSVSSSPGGINNCSTSGCLASFPFNSSVTLTANVTSPSTFAGWSGACVGASLTCIVTMDKAQTVIATFNLPPPRTLTVNITSGNGTVRSNPAGINCSPTCTFPFPHNTIVTLDALPSSPFTFGNWSEGGCSGVSPQCIVSMDQDRTVNVTFSPPGKQTLTISRNGTGTGTVTSSPGNINCGPTCASTFDYGSSVTLTAAPTVATSVFAGWSGGGCSGTLPTCVITMNGPLTVTATFNLQTRQLTVNKAGQGSGTVTSAPGGINCGTVCVFGFAHGTQVILTATPTAGSTFVRWAGSCTGTTQSCTVTLDQARTVTATFNPPPPQSPTSPPPTATTGTPPASGTLQATALGLASIHHPVFLFHETPTSPVYRVGLIRTIPTPNLAPRKREE